MNIIEAAKFANPMNSIRRTLWGEHVLRLDPELNRFVLFYRSDKIEIWTPTIGELLADDYKVVE